MEGKKVKQEEKGRREGEKIAREEIKSQNYQEELNGAQILLTQSKWESINLLRSRHF